MSEVTRSELVERARKLAPAIAEPGFKLFYCLRLIAGRLEHSFKLEFGGGPGGGTFLKDGVHKSI